jgi:hypothetical protein
MKAVPSRRGRRRGEASNIHGEKSTDTGGSIGSSRADGPRPQAAFIAVVAIHTVLRISSARTSSGVSRVRARYFDQLAPAWLRVEACRALAPSGAIEQWQAAGFDGRARRRRCAVLLFESRDRGPAICRCHGRPRRRIELRVEKIELVGGRFLPRQSHERMVRRCDVQAKSPASISLVVSRGCTTYRSIQRHPRCAVRRHAWFHFCVRNSLRAQSLGIEGRDTIDEYTCFGIVSPCHTNERSRWSGLAAARRT